MTQALIATEVLTNDVFVRSLQERISTDHALPIIPVGGRTKAGLIPAAGASYLEMNQYQGIVTYDPSEYLITAKAGTLIADLQLALARNGQYLPFDPLWVERGATLGGTIASGVSGPDRLLYGGVRDFVMEVAMLDGLGKIVRGGGKVVKNAAGFDSPKMMVGSYGRMGVLIEATLKIFPAPQAYATMIIPHNSVTQAIRAMQRVLSKPLPISSIIIDSHHQLAVRIAAPRDSLDGVIKRIKNLLPEGNSATVEQDPDAQRYLLINWIEQVLGTDQLLIRIGVSPKVIASLEPVLSNCEFFHVGACSATWARIACSQRDEVDRRLSGLGLSAVVIEGQAIAPFLGNCDWLYMAQKIQHAIDPQQRFLPWLS